MDIITYAVTLTKRDLLAQQYPSDLEEALVRALDSIETSRERDQSDFNEIQCIRQLDKLWRMVQSSGYFRSGCTTALGNYSG